MLKIRFLSSDFHFVRRELEGLDKLRGNYRMEEVQFKAEKMEKNTNMKEKEKREETNMEEEQEEELAVRLTDKEWLDQLASMTSREQMEMERFLGERGDIRILENLRCSSKYWDIFSQFKWRIQGATQNIGIFF